MAVFLVLRQFVLAVRVQVDILSSDELDLFRCEEKTVFRLTTNIHSVNVRSVFSFQVHDILMVEILDCSKQVFAVSKWNLSLALVVTTDALPNIGKHELLLFLGDRADET